MACISCVGDHSILTDLHLVGSTLYRPGETVDTLELDAEGQTADFDGHHVFYLNVLEAVVVNCRDPH